MNKNHAKIKKNAEKCVRFARKAVKLEKIRNFSKTKRAAYLKTRKIALAAQKCEKLCKQARELFNSWRGRSGRAKNDASIFLRKAQKAFEKSRSAFEKAKNVYMRLKKPRINPYIGMYAPFVCLNLTSPPLLKTRYNLPPKQGTIYFNGENYKFIKFT